MKLVLKSLMSLGPGLLLDSPLYSRKISQALVTINGKVDYPCNIKAYMDSRLSY